jgi:thiol-disulfide isomerase/thioredoxin
MPELAREAEGFLLGHRLRHAMQADAEEMKRLIGEVKAFLGQQPARSEAHLAIMAAQVAEFSGNTDLAAATYEEFGQLLAQSDDETIARLGTKMEGAARRMNLVGNELEISGTTLEGEPLDWSQYEGKAVLVVFWATWCGPCRAEIPHLREAYKMYHDRGFEIVAINCDDQRQPVDEFLAANPVPWTVLFSDDPEARGMDNPMAQKFGIMAIPATIFVGKSGKVISLQARGPALFELLAEQLGPPEEESAEESSPENAEASEAAEATN